MIEQMKNDKPSDNPISLIMELLINKTSKDDIVKMLLDKGVVATNKEGEGLVFETQEKILESRNVAISARSKNKWEIIGSAGIFIISFVFNVAAFFLGRIFYLAVGVMFFSPFWLIKAINARVKYKKTWDEFLEKTEDIKKSIDASGRIRYMVWKQYKEGGETYLGPIFGKSKEDALESASKKYNLSKEEIKLEKS